MVGRQFEMSESLEFNVEQSLDDLQARLNHRTRSPSLRQMRARYSGSRSRSPPGSAAVLADFYERDDSPPFLNRSFWCDNSRSTGVQYRDGMVTSNNPPRDWEGPDRSSHLAILRLQLDDLRYSLEYDDPDIDGRAAIQFQIDELEALLENRDDIEDFTFATRQPDLGPPVAAEIRVRPSHEPTTHPEGIATSNLSCTICMEMQAPANMVKMPCEHPYCRQCFRALVRDSLYDESLFPPRCCQLIPEVTIGSVMGSEFMIEYRAKKIEFETHIPNRIYCCNPECAQFLGPKQRIVAITRRVCERCGIGTCTRCRNIAQPEGEDYHVECVPGERDQSFLEVVRDAGYQQCYNCHRWVELNFGCNHITCLCGSEFCYVCGNRWRTCACPQWHEERLYERAAQIVDRASGPRWRAERRRHRVEQVMGHLREYHDCLHEGKWKRYFRRLRCEDCDSLRRNILQCRQCHLRACQRCSVNRRPLRATERG